MLRRKVTLPHKIGENSLNFFANDIETVLYVQHNKISEALPTPLDSWASVALDTVRAKDNWTISQIVGDASARKYFRAQSQSDAQTSLVIMACPPGEDSMRSFADIDRRLLNADVRAPKIIAHDFDLGYMLLEDFGDRLLKNELGAGEGQSLFSDILPTLNKLTQCSAQQLATFGPEKIQQELDLFSDWYCAHHLKKPLDETDNRLWQKLCAQLVDTLTEIPQRFIHLDFHSCNLLRLDDGGIGVIDFQDAMLGPICYDTVSWLWDRYISWPREDLEQWMEQARKTLSPTTDALEWQRWCDLTGLQRNLKIVGIFARLHYRDNKPGYLQLIPRFASYIVETLANYEDLSYCQAMLNEKLVDSPATHD